MKKIGFIGIGNMGGAILAGYASSGKAEGKELMAFDMDKALCERTAADIQGLVICESGRALCETADTVILGVKPQVIESVLREIKEAYKADKTVISMAAGIDIGLIERYLGRDARIIRICLLYTSRCV